MSPILPPLSNLIGEPCVHHQHQNHNQHNNHNIHQHHHHHPLTALCPLGLQGHLCCSSLHPPGIKRHPPNPPDILKNRPDTVSDVVEMKHSHRETHRCTNEQSMKILSEFLDKTINVNFLKGMFQGVHLFCKNTLNYSKVRSIDKLFAQC